MDRIYVPITAWMTRSLLNDYSKVSFGVVKPTDNGTSLVKFSSSKKGSIFF